MNQTNQNFVSVSKSFSAQDYVRTKEDEANDRAERAWKEERTRDACREFLRRHPNGRAPQYS